MRRVLLLTSPLLFWTSVAAAQTRQAAPAAAGADNGVADFVPDLRELTAPPASELTGVVNRYTADRAALLRRWDAPSPAQRSQLRAFHKAWRGRLAELDFDALGVEGRIDWTLLDHRIAYELGRLDIDEQSEREMAPLLPFQETLVALHEARRRLEPVAPRAAAEALDAANRALVAVQAAVRSGLREAAAPGAVTARREVAARAAGRVAELHRLIDDWFNHFDGYDPLFGWWARAPYKTLSDGLQAYARLLREDVAGIRPGQVEPIIGDPIGRQALLLDLHNEMIPYSPEELIAIAEEQFAWGDAEMRRAARDLGFGDDWRAALEHVKTLHVEPGRQVELVTELAHEAVAFLRERDLVTVPPLADHIWRMNMLSPERQRFAPFFLGGETVQVAFPTDAMAHEDKVMSLRANNEHFSRAVVHHELIPGHHLQGFMTQRYSTHRSAFATPFWGEGWALYWEILLYEMDFPRSPEDRIGMLFWRNHRAARIIFSLNYHLGNWTPEQAIDFLVERVGHERNSAEGEVRRSFTGQYSPLYQAAYLLGGLQLRQLHREAVGTGRMTNRAFHDHVLKSGRMPIEMVRASVLGERLPRGYSPRWRFMDRT
jgi:uncharacterized protein (DUF885 family)